MILDLFPSTWRSRNSWKGPHRLQRLVQREILPFSLISSNSTSIDMKDTLMNALPSIVKWRDINTNQSIDDRHRGTFEHISLHSLLLSIQIFQTIYRSIEYFQSRFSQHWTNRGGIHLLFNESIDHSILLSNIQYLLRHPLIQHNSISRLNLRLNLIRNFVQPEHDMIRGLSMFLILFQLNISNIYLHPLHSASHASWSTQTNVIRLINLLTFVSNVSCSILITELHQGSVLPKFTDISSVWTQSIYV